MHTMISALQIYLTQAIPTSFSSLEESCPVFSRRIYEILAVGNLHPHWGNLKDSLGRGYLDMLMKIRGAKWEVTQFSPIWVTQGLSMSQRVCWEEALTHSTIFASGNCEIGRLLIGFCLGRSKAEFGRHLLRWWLRILSVLVDCVGNARLVAWRSALWVWTFLDGICQWWCLGLLQFGFAFGIRKNCYGLSFLMHFGIGLLLCGSLVT